MKSSSAVLDFVNDEITLFGNTVQLQHTSSGHYCLPVCAQQSVLSSNAKDQNMVFLSINDLEHKTAAEKREIATKLHKRFGHPIDSNKLKDFLSNAGIHDVELNEHILMV